jgi:hypothetical protein
MNWLPGWDSIENTGWWSSFYFWVGTACLVGTLFSTVLNYFYSSHRDRLVATANAKEVASLNRQLEETSRQVVADHSLKNRIRNLFSFIDPNILREIDAGKLELAIRMQPNDIESLQKLLSEPGGEEFVVMLTRGQKILNSHISNGTLGPQGAVAEQEKIMVKALPTLRVINP